MHTLRSFAVVGSYLLLTLLPARFAAAAGRAAGTTPTEAVVQRLGRAAHLAPAQLPAVRVATERYVRALARLDRQRFASAAAASAAYTVVEFGYCQALQRVLSAKQLAAYQHLDDDAPALTTTRP